MNVKEDSIIRANKYLIWLIDILLMQHTLPRNYLLKLSCVRITCIDCSHGGKRWGRDARQLKYFRSDTTDTTLDIISDFWKLRSVSSLNKNIIKYHIFYNLYAVDSIAITIFMCHWSLYNNICLFAIYQKHKNVITKIYRASKSYRHNKLTIWWRINIHLIIFSTFHIIYITNFEGKTSALEIAFVTKSRNLRFLT